MLLFEGGDVGVRDVMCGFGIEERFGSHGEGDVFDTTYVSVSIGKDRG